MSEPRAEPGEEPGGEPGAEGESAPATDESDAFISYSHLDREFAVRLRDALRDAGKRPWLDETEISGGARWSDALERAIEHADAFVFLLSPHSAGSTECRRELDYALALNRRILPLRIADTPTETLPPRLAEYQFIPSRALFGADFAGSTQVSGTPAPHAAGLDAVARSSTLVDSDPADLLTPLRAYLSGDSLIVFDVASGRTLATLPDAGGGLSTSFDAAGNVMLVTRSHSTPDSGTTVHLPAELRLTHGGRLLHTLPGLAGHALDGVFSPDGKLVATVDASGAMSVWNVASGRRLTLFRRDQGPASNPESSDVWVEFSPDGRFVLSSDVEGRSFVWRPIGGHVVVEMHGTRDPPAELTEGQPGALASGAISPDDRFVVLARASSDDASVYQFGSSTPFLTLVGNTAAIGDVAFSPDSQLIETTDGFQVSVYDTRNAQPLLTLPVRNGSEASAVGFSADGRSLIADTAFPYETYPCSICGGFDQLLPAAREREVGRITPQEQDLYLN